jgi:uncharacterized repeat protein (TIGR01451 family)
MTLRGKLGALLGAGLLSFALFGTTSATGQSVAICHATNSETNPYIAESPAINSSGAFIGLLAGGHNGHTGPIWVPGDKAAKITWGDIIPAYTYAPTSFSFLGLNWPAGQAILDNGCKIPVTPGPAILSASKAVDKATAAPGDTLTYTIEVANTGGTDATGVVVTDNITALLAHGTFGTCDNSCAHDATSVSWTVTVPKGGLIDLHFTIVLSATGWSVGTTHLPNTVVVAGTNCAANALPVDPGCSTDTTVTVGAVVVPTPSPTPTGSGGGGGAGATPSPSPTPTHKGGGGGGGAGGGPTQPPTDTLGSTNSSGPSDGAWLLVVALGVLLASVVVLTPARAKNRR